MINLSFMNGKIKESILIRDFLNDRTYVVDAAPGQKTLSAEITHQKSGEKVFSVERVRRGYVLATGPAADSVFVDGKEGQRVDLKVDEDYSVFDGSNLLLIRVTENASGWKKTIEKDTWSITDLHSDKAAGPMPLSDLLESMDLFLSEFEAGVNQSLLAMSILSVMIPFIRTMSALCRLSVRETQPSSFRRPW